MTDTQTRDLFADVVRDNSGTVTDYAFSRHLSPGCGRTSTTDRDSMIQHADRFDYRRYQWHDVNPDGQRCRFDMLTRPDGTVVYLFHTEYYTRVKCDRCEYSWAQRYVVTTGNGWTTDPVPLCGNDLDMARRANRHDNAHGHAIVLTESEPLRIGQHD